MVLKPPFDSSHFPGNLLQKQPTEENIRLSKLPLTLPVAHHCFGPRSRMCLILYIRNGCHHGMGEAFVGFFRAP